MVVTDRKLSKMKPVETVLKALDSQDVPYQLYDRVAVEPTDERLRVMCYLLVWG